MSFSPRILVDYTGPVQMSMHESSTSDMLVVEGKCGQCDTPTANGRVYPRRIMEREVNRLKDKISRNAAVGSVDHPGDGKSRITDIGHMIKDIWIEDDGSIKGRFKIIEGTRKGKDLAAVLKAGVAIGMSSRGLGSTVSGTTPGRVTVGEDFKLSTFDFVVEPAVGDAYPAMMAEDVDIDISPFGELSETDVSVLQLRKKFPKLVSSIEGKSYCLAQEEVENAVRSELAEDQKTTIKQFVDDAIEETKESIRNSVVIEERAKLVDEFSVKLIRALQSQRQEVEESVRSELLSDPSVAGAKMAMERVSKIVNPFTLPVDASSVISERDDKIEELESALTEKDTVLMDANAKLAEIEEAKKGLQYALFVEKAVSGREDAESIKDMIGDISLIGSPDELQERLERAIVKANKLVESAKSAFADEKILHEQRIKSLKKRNQEFRNLAEQERSEFADKIDNLNDSFTSKMAELEERLQANNENLARERGRTARLQEALELSTDTLEVLNTRRYAEERTIGHPKRREILEKVERSELRTEGEVDQMAQRYGNHSVEAGGASERVRRAFSSGYERPLNDDRTLTETRSVPGNIPGLDQLGIKLEDIMPRNRRGK